MRVAAVDCGTNSIRLLVSEDGADVVRTMEIVRLGEGVDATGVLAPAALDRTFEALRRYARVIEDEKAERVRMVATSATRDAANAAEFTAGCERILGVAPEVLSGAEEAALSFRGATKGLAAEGPYLVADIGGGSTEVVTADAAISVDIGCVRLTERCMRSDPPTPDEIAGAERVVAEALDEIDRVVDARPARTFVGLAGSVTTVAAIALGLDAYRPELIHGARITRDQVEDVTARLLAATREERAAMAVMHPGRVDVIGGGALVLRALLRRWDLPAVVASERDILDGIVHGLLAQNGK